MIFFFRMPAEIRDRHEAIVAGLARPEIGNVITLLLDPLRSGKQPAALSTGMIFDKKMWIGRSEHDAFPYSSGSDLTAGKSDASRPNAARHEKNTSWQCTINVSITDM